MTYMISQNEQRVSTCMYWIALYYFVGDGNFLAAASRVPFSNHMVVGINTDPDR